MQNINAILRLPHHQCNGNLLWGVISVKNRSTEINSSIEKFRALGYWISEFPEGDGATFTYNGLKKSLDELSADINKCFEWLNISIDIADMDKAAAKRSPIPSLGYEDSITIEKIELALIQLEDAIDLFLTGKRFSSITLASAADGIMTGLLKQKGIKSAAEDTWESIKETREKTGLDIAGDRTQKEIFNEWNFYQNRLKHHDLRDDENLEINIFDHAYHAIKRAMSDAKKLNRTPKNENIFEKWCFDNIFT